MNNTECPRCDNLFFTAQVSTEIACPFCGYSFNVEDFSKVRKSKRSFIERDCNIFRGNEKLLAKTINISKGGIGIKVHGPLPFLQKDALHIIIDDFEIDSSAEVMWVRNVKEGLSTAGMKFR